MKSLLLLALVVTGLYACTRDSTRSDEPDGNETSLTGAAMLSSVIQLGSSVYDAGLRGPARRRWADSFLPEAHADLGGGNGGRRETCVLPAPGACSAGESSESWVDCTRGGIHIDTGTTSYVFRTAANAAFCPSPATWEKFFGTVGAKAVRLFHLNGNTAGGNPLQAFTAQVSGWDSSVTLTPNPITGSTADFGALVTATTGGGTVRVHGIQYVVTPYLGWWRDPLSALVPSAWADIASGSGKTVTALWNHTLSSDALTLTMTGTGGARKVLDSGTGAFVVQHNVLRYTARSKISALTWNHATSGCGCRPVSGTITTTFSGSREGGEKITFGSSQCGEYTQQATDASGNPKGSAKTGTLAYCL